MAFICVLNINNNNNNNNNNSKKKKKKKKGKVMHEQHVRQTEDFACLERWQWLRQGSLKRDTESFLVATHGHALRLHESESGETTRLSVTTMQDGPD